MGWIAGLPCVACLTLGRETALRRRRGVHVAHVRMADAEAGWRETGMAEKPSDRRTVPLCPEHHVNGPEAQHNMGERGFWEWLGIDPAALCTALSAAFDLAESGDPVIIRFAAKAAATRQPEDIL